MYRLQLFWNDVAGFLIKMGTSETIELRLLAAKFLN